MIEKDFDNNNENVIDWLTGQKFVTVSFTNRRHINRIKNIYKERPDDFKYFIENEDGSICAKFPLKWIKVNPGAKLDPDKPKRIMSDEEKQALAKRLAAGRIAKANANK